MTKNVILRGPNLIQSGYGCHARQVAKFLLGLEEKGRDIKVSFQNLPWGVCTPYVNPDFEDGLIGKMMQRPLQPGTTYHVSFQLQLPNEWDPFLAQYNIGMTAAVETDRCNPAWIDAVNRMQLVIVPSEFTKKVLLSSGTVTTPIEVIPESWFNEIRNIDQNTNSLIKKLNFQTKFNFLMVSQFTGHNAENDRKNIAYTIKWFCEEFKNNEDVGLIIKTNSGRQTKADKRVCLNLLTQIIAQVKQGKGPKIYLLHGAMSNKELVELYTHPSVKALVSLTRGEGFGLPLLEAAAAGLPVIATDWSAHTEFLGLGKYIKVDYTLSKIHESRVDNKIFMPDAKWAFPVEADAKRKLKRFYSNSSIPKQWATDLRNILINSHSPETIEAKYTKLLEGVL